MNNNAVLFEEMKTMGDDKIAVSHHRKRQHAGNIKNRLKLCSKTDDDDIIPQNILK